MKKHFWWTFIILLHYTGQSTQVTMLYQSCKYSETPPKNKVNINYNKNFNLELNKNEMNWLKVSHSLSWYVFCWKSTLQLIVSMKCIRHFTLLYKQLYGKAAEKPHSFPDTWKSFSDEVLDMSLVPLLENASWTLKFSCLASSKNMLCSLFTHNYSNVWHIPLVYLKSDTDWNFSLHWEVLISLYCLNNISLVAHRCKTTQHP